MSYPKKHRGRRKMGSKKRLTRHRVRTHHH